MSEADALLEQLARLQDENFALNERISSYKRSRSPSRVDAAPAEDVPARIDELKHEITRVEREKSGLTGDLSRLIRAEEQLQTQIREGEAEVTGTLLPRLATELQETDDFYNTLLAQLGAASSEQLDEFRQLIAEVRQKRSTTMADRREYQNVNRLIQYELSRAGIAARAKPSARSGQIRRGTEADLRGGRWKPVEESPGRASVV